MTKTNDSHPTAEVLNELEDFLQRWQTSSYNHDELIYEFGAGAPKDAPETAVYLRVSTLRVLLQLARAAQARVYVDHGGADWAVIADADGTMLYQNHVYEVLERVAETALGVNLRYVDTISDDIRIQAAHIDGHRGTRFAAGTRFDADGRAVVP